MESALNLSQLVLRVRARRLRARGCQLFCPTKIVTGLRKYGIKQLTVNDSGALLKTYQEFVLIGYIN